MKKDDLIDRIDEIINKLVKPKKTLLTAYNYYNGIMSLDDFKYLEDNYGLGTPTSIEFIPLVRKHVDALVGEYLETPIIPKVSCKDEKTLSNINRDKQLKILEEVNLLLQRTVNNSIVKILTGNSEVDPNIQGSIDQLIEDLDKNYISEYELAASNVVTYLIQSRHIDFVNKIKDIVLDLLIGGQNYYRVKPNKQNTNLDLIVYNPLNTFVEYNPESNYVKHARSAVTVKFLTKENILHEYGSELSAENIKKLADLEEAIGVDNETFLEAGYNTNGLVGCNEVRINENFVCDEIEYSSLIPVYEVEFLHTSKKEGEWVVDRYYQTRIAQNIYILNTSPEKTIRSRDYPNNATITLNGVFFRTRTNTPYSLVLATRKLQDKYNVLHFIRDNIIAGSGSVGERLDIKDLPIFLGNTIPERILQWQAFSKNGVKIYDSSQSGMDVGNNTLTGTYDETLRLNAIQAIELAIERVENTCSSITGVFRERLNGIQQRDAVSNVEVGVKNSYTVTKQYFQQMDTVSCEVISDALNVAKVVFSKGITGTIVLGDKLQRIFTAKPQYFTTTDHDVHILSSSEINKQLELIKQISFDLIKGGQVDAAIVIESITSNSLSDFKYNVLNSLKKQNKLIQQLQEQAQAIEELKNQVKQLSNENKKLQTKLDNIKEGELELKRQELAEKTKIEWHKAQTLRIKEEYWKEIAEIRNKLEYDQMFDRNPYNNEITNV